MSTLTLSDVREYLDAFKTKYGRDTSLTLDAMESIIMSAEADMTADDFAEAFKEAEVEDTPAETDDRSAIVDTSPGSAYDYASKMDKQLEADLETSAEAALENKRGAAVIGLDLIRIYGHETIVSVWPEPASKAEPGTMKIGNRWADKYKSQVTKTDGTTAEGDRSWYSDYTENSPRGKMLIREKKSLEAVKKGEKGPQVIPDHEALRNDNLKLATYLAAVNGKVNNLKQAIVRSVNLIQRMHYLNTQTEMACELILDGTEPVKSNKLIYVYDKKDQKKFNILTIGQLLALKVIEGGTYAQISGTTQRQGKAGQGPQAVEVKVNSLGDFDKVVLAQATFVDDINQALARKDMKAYNALLTHLNSAGSDDLLVQMNNVMGFFEGLLSKPGIARKLADALAKEKQEAKAA